MMMTSRRRVVGVYVTPTGWIKLVVDEWGNFKRVLRKIIINEELDEKTMKMQKLFN